MRALDNSLWFPPLTQASPEGLLAYGGDLSPERLLLAYRSGIFPWYEEGQPILWWSPDPRMVLYPEALKISKSFRKRLRTHSFRCTMNEDFEGVIDACASIARKGQAGTWITEEMKAAYLNLHQLGHAVSVEVWEDDSLVGGLYGIDLTEKRVFCGESMFSYASDASKIALHYLVQQLLKEDYTLIDCQMHTAHLERLGAKEIPRARFLKYLES